MGIVFIAYTQLFINKKQANFILIGTIFGPAYSDTPSHLYTTSIAFKLYTTQTVSIPQTHNILQKITNCSKILILTKLLQKSLC